MPTTQQESQIRDHQAKITAFKVEIDRLATEVRNLRHQKTIEADKTVASLNSDIPVLQAKKSQLEMDNFALQQAIIDNQCRANDANRTAETHYKNLEAELLKSHQKKQAELNKQTDDLVVAKANHYQAVAAHKQAEAELQSRVSIHESYKVAREAQIKSDLQQIAKSNSELSFKKVTLTTQEQKLNDKIKEVNEASEKMNVRDAAFKTIQRQCDGILARIEEAQKILDEANRIKQENAQADIRLNQLKTEAKAQAVKDSQRKDALDKRESELNERQKNIELLEAQHG